MSERSNTTATARIHSACCCFSFEGASEICQDKHNEHTRTRCSFHLQSQPIHGVCMRSVRIGKQQQPTTESCRDPEPANMGVRARASLFGTTKRNDMIALPRRGDAQHSQRAEKHCAGYDVSTWDGTTPKKRANGWPVLSLLAGLHAGHEPTPTSKQKNIESFAARGATGATSVSNVRHKHSALCTRSNPPSRGG